MGRIETLIRNYEEFVKLPWDKNIAGQQKVWFAVYDPQAERRLRCRIEEFELVTRSAGHAWKIIDLNDIFSEWMAAQEYRESYFENPDDLEFALEDFRHAVIDRVASLLTFKDVDDNAVVAIYGLPSLFGFMRVATLMEKVSSYIRGRLLVFFPGEHEGTTYRFLDAQDGWNYLAVPILSRED